MIIGVILTEIVTVCLSIGIEFKNLFSLFNKIADNGYTLDLKKFEEFTKENQTRLMDKFFWNFVPVINILNTLRRDRKYKAVDENNLSELCNHVCFRKMTDEEKKMYLDMPNGLFAIFVPLISDKLESTFSGKYTEINEENDYFVEFNLDSKTGEVTFKNMNIQRCNLSVNQIKDNIRNTFLSQHDSIEDKHNMDLRNISVKDTEPKAKNQKNSEKQYVANYEIKYGDTKISRKLTPTGYDQMSRLISEDLELLEKEEGPKLRLK